MVFELPSMPLWPFVAAISVHFLSSSNSSPDEPATLACFLSFFTSSLKQVHQLVSKSQCTESMENSTVFSVQLELPRHASAFSQRRCKTIGTPTHLIDELQLVYLNSLPQFSLLSPTLIGSYVLWSRLRGQILSWSPTFQTMKLEFSFSTVSSLKLVIGTVTVSVWFER